MNTPPMPDPEIIEASIDDLKWVAVLLLGLSESSQKFGFSDSTLAILDHLATRWRGRYLIAALEADDLNARWDRS